MSAGKITRNALLLLDWSAGELTRIANDAACVYLSDWQANKKERSLWIGVSATLAVDKLRTRPAGYHLKRDGEIIESGEFEWSRGNVFLKITNTKGQP